jgi:long-chain fatty acid transport protein
MRKAAVILLLCLLGVWCAALPAWGGGIGISGVGAKAKAMGGAFRAIADDWSAAYYNPAGLFYTTESQLTFNEVFTHYQVTYTPEVNYGGYGVGFFDGQIYNRYKILSNPTMGGYFKIPFSGQEIALGMAIFQPFDKNISWKVFHPLNNDADLPGQQIEHNFDAVAVNVMSAIELMENRLSFGISAGLLKSDLAYGGFFLRPNPADPSRAYYDQVASRPNELITEWQKSEGEGFSPNVRAGLLFKPTPRLNFGVTYAFRTTATIDGQTNLFYFMPDNPAYNTRPDVRIYTDSLNYILSSGAKFATDADFETEVTLPAQLGAGLAYQVNERLLVAGDIEYTFWSDFDGYLFDYSFADTGISGNSIMNAWMTQDMALPADWKNTIKGSVGLQYAFRDGILIRSGYSADQSPLEQGTLHPAFFDPGLKHSFNLGLGLVFENIILDFSTEYLLYPESRETGNTDIALGDIGSDSIADNMSGTYEGSAFESIIQFTVRF